MRTWAAVPYRDKAELTTALLRQLNDEPALEGVILLDHASSTDTAEQIRGVTAEARLLFDLQWFPPETTLTEMWNVAVDIAVAEKLDSLMFLNNDLVLPERFVGPLRDALWADDQLWAICPDWHRAVSDGVHLEGVQVVRGAERHGGMCGWAFMVKVGAWTLGGLARFDEQFRFWCADDDLAFSIEQAGYKVGLLRGLPVDHLRSQTLVTRPELVEVCHDDLARCKRKWNER